MGKLVYPQNRAIRKRTMVTVKEIVGKWRGCLGSLWGQLL